MPTIAVFSHHAAIRCVLRALVEASPRMLSPKLNLANTGITELVYTADKTGRLGGWVGWASTHGNCFPFFFFFFLFWGSVWHSDATVVVLVGPITDIMHRQAVWCVH